jgi:DNA-binding Lrp family transcriptional regulator
VRTVRLDHLDVALLRLLVEEPRAGARVDPRISGVARGTVTSRINRLERAGAIVGYGAHIAPSALGFDVEAFVHLHLAQGMLDAVSARLADIPEVLEAYSTTGEGDVLCRIVAPSNAELEHLVQSLLAVPGVVRTKTEMAMRHRVSYRVLPLLQKLAQQA